MGFQHGRLPKENSASRSSQNWLSPCIVKDGNCVSCSIAWSTCLAALAALGHVLWEGQTGCDQVGEQLVPSEKAGQADPAPLPPPWRRASYLPLGKGGNATDFSFLSSAADRQFLMVSSSCSSHLSEPH